GQMLDKIRNGAFLELCHTDIADAVVQHFAAHAAHLDHIAHDSDHQRLVTTLSHDGQHDGGFGFATHQLDGVVQRHALGRLAVDMGNQVACKYARPCRRRVFDGRDDLRHAVLAADFYTQPPEAALRDGLHFLERLGVEVG